jgi:hypothetical protein
VSFVIAGRLAALAQGLPVRPTRLDLIVEESAVPAASSALDRLSHSRWNERHHDYLDFSPGLDAPGPRRWLVAGLYELRIEVVPTLTPTVPIVVAGQRLSLLRLADLLRVDPDVAALHHRIGEWSAERSAERGIERSAERGTERSAERVTERSGRGTENGGS